MAHTRVRLLSCLFATFLAFPFPSAAFDTPLSDTAVRQAYFMGQRHDESLGRFLDKYIKHLRAPKPGRISLRLLSSRPTRFLLSSRVSIPMVTARSRPKSSTDTGWRLCKSSWKFN